MDYVFFVLDTMLTNQLSHILYRLVTIIYAVTLWITSTHKRRAEKVNWPTTARNQSINQSFNKSKHVTCCE